MLTNTNRKRKAEAPGPEPAPVVPAPAAGAPPEEPLTSVEDASEMVAARGKLSEIESKLTDVEVESKDLERAAVEAEEVHESEVLRQELEGGQGAEEARKLMLAARRKFSLTDDRKKILRRAVETQKGRIEALRLQLGARVRPQIRRELEMNYDASYGMVSTLRRLRQEEEKIFAKAKRCPAVQGEKLQRFPPVAVLIDGSWREMSSDGTLPRLLRLLCGWGFRIAGREMWGGAMTRALAFFALPMTVASILFVEDAAQRFTRKKEPAAAADQLKKGSDEWTS